MADKYKAIATGVALVATTPKTVLQIATPSTIRARASLLSIQFDGITAGNVPGLVELLRQTSSGTGTAVTPVATDSAAPASLVTALKNHTVEPAGTTAVDSWTVSPNGGSLLIPFYGFDQPVLPVSGFLGIRCTFANAVNVTAELTFLA